MCLKDSLLMMVVSFEECWFFDNKLLIYVNDNPTPQ
jgi:hypothetical protein